MSDEQWEFREEEEQDEDDATYRDAGPSQGGLGQILGDFSVDIKPENKQIMYISIINKLYTSYVIGYNVFLFIFK